ncbi:FecR domain-containing protein [Pseudomonas sp. JQ170]|uniref:FecR family protein n=1 Tax=unclassified Pseudomonas TaxID=196821 RepID=UPI00264E4703|nr:MULTISPECIES: FecR domain-containing protein [unclassified Pseudomonas]MDN7141225.1 FecR domain-containing protein [Pseudomonas sp. JQ170]WRO78193.1 FecR domain-containing protein [Pseudomonas sp. 170C]
MSTAREQAALWFARLYNAAADHPERAQFETWLAADPLHQSEYRELAELWGDFSCTRRSQALAQAMEQNRQRPRRRLLHGSVLAVLLTVAGAFGWHTHRYGALQLHLATGIGERQVQQLRDGTELMLDADTHLHLHFDHNLRQVELLRGEAIFSVARQPERPFVIDGGLAQVRVLGTRFVVNRLPDRLRISVDHGRVQVDSLSRPGESQVLKAGEVAEVSADGRLHRVARAANDAFTFEFGRLVFDQADLAEVAASLSRYRQTPVRAGAGKSPRISAVVQLSDIEGFLQSLPQVVPVNVKHEAGATVLQPLLAQADLSKTTARLHRK